MRRVLFWMHLVAGVLAGVVILVMSLTGVLLAYEKQIVVWADAAPRVSPPSGEATRLGLEALVARVREARPTAGLTAITVRSDPGAPVQVAVGREGVLYVDGYRGDVVSEGSKAAREFFHGVTDWHRWLATEGASRAAGRGVTGAANLVYLFLVVSGLFLWWPRAGTRHALRLALVFQKGLRGRLRDFNWHTVAGFWSALPLFFVVVTGAVMSYPWANDLLYRLAGSEPPARRPGGPGGPAGAGGAAAGSSTGEGRRRPELKMDGVDALFARAESTVEGWRTIGFRLPTSPDEPVTFTIDKGNGARPDLRAQLALDRKTAAVVRFEPYASQSLGRQLRTWARWVHTGEAGGLVGQTIAGTVSGVGALLVWTGLAMAWRRFFRRADVPAPVPTGAETVSGASSARAAI